VLKSLVVFDFEAERERFIAEVAPLVRAGTVRYREDRADGIAATPAHFARLMAGETFGKALVVLDPDADAGA
jgi:NADPH-dependent curcumin reductase CurA